MNLTPHQEAMIDIGRVAFRKDASDIHIEPTRDGTIVRLRIDGTLKQIQKIDGESSSLFIEQVKQLLGFDMGTLGMPQDSRWSHPDEMVDFRCNIFPIIHGEKLCLRLLERDKKFSLESYPLFDEPKSDLFRLINKKSGLIIVSGPTGSGKSTLLYSVLGSIDREKLNVNTVEDPIEYELEGLNQSGVDKKKGYGFADALRALMRQDPDVIMVGEIRDEETAEAALHAASTGHLVLTTVHANDSKEILTRLAGLGVPREPIEAALLFASAQRLARKLCDHCKVEAPEDIKLLDSFFGVEVDFMPQKEGEGCEMCDHQGIKGRRLVFEHLQKDESKIERPLGLSGSLRDSTFELVRKGEISANEAYGQFL